jgi:3-hydroxyisobutyrate dehydrogenase-like beta-hydroxyacid dehydrogenase
VLGLGQDPGAYASQVNMKKLCRSILVDHTTSSPSLAMKIHERAKQKGIVSIDAPVSGG